MKAKKEIFIGNRKSIYNVGDGNSFILSFNDKVNLPDGKTVEVFGKGILVNSISAHLMQSLDTIGVENHFIEKINMRQQKVQAVDLYPIQIILSTIASGRYCTDFDLEEGFVFDHPVIDFRIKNRELNYPVMNESQMLTFNWIDAEDLKDIKNQSARILDFLSGMFSTVKIRIVELKLEFGQVLTEDGVFNMLADEISPDNCLMWDMESNEKLSYDLARDKPEKIIEAYQEISDRLGISKKR